jgi:hypothetical protein
MSGEGAEHYADKVRELEHLRKWKRGYSFLPHDVRVREWGSNKTRLEQLIEFGIRPTRVPRHEVDDGINAVRSSFPRFEFDANGCAEGLKALRSYRREWNEDKGVWSNKPRHDWASHGADAIRYAAMSWHDRMKTTLADVEPPAEDTRMKVLHPTDHATQRGITLDDLWDLRPSRRRSERV